MIRNELRRFMCGILLTPLLVAGCYLLVGSLVNWQLALIAAFGNLCMNVGLDVLWLKRFIGRDHDPWGNRYSTLMRCR